MPGERNQLADAIRVIQALRRGPMTTAAIADELELGDRKVRRIVEALEEAGAPIERKEMERIGERGFAPEGVRITVEGLRKWLG